MTDVPELRRRYSETLRAAANLRSAALVQAFARVPREHFLGPGPWQIMLLPGGGGYEMTADADPAHLYRNVVVAIDPTRFLNNGHPSSLAQWFDALDLRSGERVLHVGCGVGYYTAILAETVGAAGQVTGIEIDAELAERARANLTYLPHVSVLHGDGAGLDTGPRDAIFINAGATHPQPLWLDRLTLGGRLMLPLTASLDADNTESLGMGLMLKVTRERDGYVARFVSPVGIFPCIGTRGADQPLHDAFARGNWEAVRSLRRDPHGVTDACWLHGAEVCLSTAGRVD